MGYPTGGALAGVWEDTSGDPASANWAQLAIEAVRAAKHFGNGTQADNRDAQYVIVTPTGANPLNYPAFACGWRDHTGDPTLTALGPVDSSLDLAFTFLPYLPDHYDTFAPVGGYGFFDGVSVVAAQYYAGAVTDPLGWGWTDSSGQPIDWKCVLPPNSADPVVQKVTFATGTFLVPSLWANDDHGGTGGCEISHPIVTNDLTPIAPVVTSAAGETVDEDVAGSFLITTTGFPFPAITESGALPSGVTLTDLGNATAVLGGIPATGSAGTYPVEISATNAGGTAQQAFILTVSAAGGTVASVAGDANGGAGYGGDFGPGTGGLLYSPRAVAVDEWGDVFIADSFNNQIREVDTFGNIYRIAGDGQPGYSGDAGLGIYAALNNPQGITVDNEGDVFVADTSSHVVREIDTHDVITTVAGNGTYGDSGDGGPAVAAEFWEPAGLVFDKAGDLFVADQATGRIRRVGIDGTVSAFAGRSNPNGDPDGGDGGLALAATFRLPTTLAIAASGAMYVTDLSGLRVIAANGTVSTLGTGSYVSRDASNGGPVSGAYLSGCRGLAVDPTGNVYLGCISSVMKIDTHGIITYVADSLGASGNSGDGGPARRRCSDTSRGWHWARVASCTSWIRSTTVFARSWAGTSLRGSPVATTPPSCRARPSR